MFRSEGALTMTARLQSSRLTLRAWEDGDRAAFFEMSSDPAVMQYLTPLTTREASDAWIDRHRAHFAAHGLGYWAVELQETRQLAGAVGLSRVTYQAHFTPAIGVGWRLARHCWGHGYASEAAAVALRFGFEELRPEEIVAVTVPANIRSQQVMRRLGMTYSPADDFDHPRYPEGHPWRRCVLFRLSRLDWSNRQA
jgi:RimJ/RimL family protein N-acetyltransferase